MIQLDWGHCLLLNVPKLEPESKLIPLPQTPHTRVQTQERFTFLREACDTTCRLITSTRECVWGGGVYSPNWPLFPGGCAFSRLPQSRWMEAASLS